MNTREGALIECRGISKQYHLWHHSRDRFRSLLCDATAMACPPAAPFLRAAARRGRQEFFALHAIDLQVAPGESLGIVGRNGSGKSTLLQILAGILRPSAGTVRVRGRVAALLELGAGFNPEFTGRENARLNAAILGLDPAGIDSRMEEILAFADIGEFVDQPVKVYSSGMLVRLSFAVQVALEPDILIVDEALAVGDEAFQRKCFARIEALRRRGVTLLFVSHSSSQITALCTRAVLLSQGRKVADGTPLDIINQYHRELYGGSRMTTAAGPAGSRAGSPEPETPAQPAEKWEGLDPSLLSQSAVPLGLGQAELSPPLIENRRGKSINTLVHGELYTVRYRVRFLSAASRIVCSVNVKTLGGFLLGSAKSHNEPEFHPETVPAGETWDLSFRLRCVFLPGTYSMDIGLRGDGQQGDHILLAALNDVLLFRVVNTGNIPHRGVISFCEGTEVRTIGEPAMPEQSCA